MIRIRVFLAFAKSLFYNKFITDDRHHEQKKGNHRSADAKKRTQSMHERVK